MRKPGLAVLAAAIACLLAGPVLGQEPQTPTTAEQAPDMGEGSAASGEEGRFSLEETDDGYLRLDRETGATSLCIRRGGQLVCRIAADERSALMAEISRLSQGMEKAQEEIATLQGRLAGAREDSGGGAGVLDKPEQAGKDGETGEAGQGGTVQDQQSGSGEEGGEETAERDELERAIDYSTLMLRRFFEMVREFRESMEREG